MQEVQKKYEFQAQIGQGSFSKIYLVKNRVTEQQWAVKHTDKKIVKPKNYQREVDVLRRISHRKHPNIVAVEEILEDEENVFIVQEYLPAGNLLIYLSRHAPLAESHAQRIYAPILDAMEFLHSCGIAHRDIKLENILMTADGVPKIIDFNLSCFWDDDSKQTTFCGSQEYCAPEIFLRHSYKGPEVDVWSLGVLLYTLLFCEFPFKPTKDANNAPVPISSKVIKCELNFPEQHFASEAAVEVIRFALDPSFSTRPTLRQVLNLSWFRIEKVEPLVFASAFKAPSANDMVLHTNSHNQEELHEEYLKKYYNEQFHPSSSDPERKGKLRERSNTSIGVVTTPQSNFKTFWAKVLRVGKSLHFHSNV